MNTIVTNKIQLNRKKAGYVPRSQKQDTHTTIVDMPEGKMQVTVDMNKAMEIFRKYSN
jgi:hypothetical protein